MAGGNVHRNGRVRGPWVDFRLGYQPAFDGLRGIGVTIIVLYHGAILYQGRTHPSFLPGAQMWLELFFVQSGFLITSFVLEEWHRTGEVRLRRFYLRRAARLAPALLAVAAFSAVALLTFSPFKGLDQPWWELGAAVAYVENWVAAFGVTDYPFYMGHTWSLGIEQQFYLVAPLLVLLLVAGSRSLRRPLPLLVAGAVASAVWMAVLASRTVEPVELQRPYYGTDSRAQGLLIGVALAFALHSGVWLRGTRTQGAVAAVWGHLGFVVMVWVAFSADIREKDLFYGTFLLCAVAVAGILSEVIAHPRGPMARSLSFRPFRWTGARAYGLYLWHWPIVMVVGQYTDWGEFETIAAEVAVSFAVAALSYQVLERPIMRRVGRPPPPGGGAATGRRPRSLSTLSGRVSCCSPTQAWLRPRGLKRRKPRHSVPSRLAQRTTEISCQPSRRQVGHIALEDVPGPPSERLLSPDVGRACAVRLVTIVAEQHVARGSRFLEAGKEPGVATTGVPVQPVRPVRDRVSTKGIDRIRLGLPRQRRTEDVGCRRIPDATEPDPHVEGPHRACVDRGVRKPRDHTEDELDVDHPSCVGPSEQLL